MGQSKLKSLTSNITWKESKGNRNTLKNPTIENHRKQYTLAHKTRQSIFPAKTEFNYGILSQTKDFEYTGSASKCLAIHGQWEMYLAISIHLLF